MLTELEMLTKFWKSPFFQKGTFLSIKYSKGLFLYITKKVCERTISVEDHNKSKKKKKNRYKLQGAKEQPDEIKTGYCKNNFEMTPQKKSLKKD